MTEMTTEELLAQRATTHGEYVEHARCTQAIMDAVMKERNWDSLPPMMKESLHMFAHKMGRVVTGNPNIHDHWDDIAGYAKLVSQRIPKPEDVASAVTRKLEETASETEAMDRYVEKNLFGGRRRAQASGLMVEEPFGYEEKREVELVPRRMPVTINYVDFTDQMYEKIEWGTMGEHRWSELYNNDDAATEYRMIPAYVMEYGKPA